MWECNKCREQIEDSFEVCWSCGTSKDGVEDPDFESVKEPEEAVVDVYVGPQPVAPLYESEPHSSQPRARLACAKCGSLEVIDDVHATDSDGVAMRLRRFKRPGQIVFAGPLYADLLARVCLTCGATEFYTNTAKDLVWPLTE